MAIQLLAVSADNGKDGLRRYTLGADLPESINTAEEGSIGKICSFHPAIHTGMRPGRNRHRTNAATFAEQIGNKPATIPLLDMGNVQGGYLGPAKPCADKQSE